MVTRPIGRSRFQIRFECPLDEGPREGRRDKHDKPCDGESQKPENCDYVVSGGKPTGEAESRSDLDRPHQEPDGCEDQGSQPRLRSIPRERAGRVPTPRRRIRLPKSWVSAARLAGRQGFSDGQMTHRFEIVAVRVTNEGCVVELMVVRAEPGRTVVCGSE